MLKKLSLQIKQNNKFTNFTVSIHITVPDALTIERSCHVSPVQHTQTSYHVCKQESPANAQGSARQPWYIVRKSPNRPPFRIAQQYQRNLYIVENYFQCTTIPSLTLWVYLHSFSRCSRSNMPTSAKFRENLNVQQFKVIQGR